MTEDMAFLVSGVALARYSRHPIGLQVLPARVFPYFTLLLSSILQRSLTPRVLPPEDLHCMSIRILHAVRCKCVERVHSYCGAWIEFAIARSNHRIDKSTRIKSTITEYIVGPNA